MQTAVDYVEMSGKGQDSVGHWLDSLFRQSSRCPISPFSANKLSPEHLRPERIGEAQNRL